MKKKKTAAALCKIFFTIASVYLDDDVYDVSLE